MGKFLLSAVLGCLMVAQQLFCEENEKKDPATYHISEEDMEIIKHLEILELMEVAEKLQLLREMDILIEDENYAKQN